jgi:hypothetical protein
MILPYTGGAPRAGELRKLNELNESNRLNRLNRLHGCIVYIRLKGKMVVTD